MPVARPPCICRTLGYPALIWICRTSTWVTVTSDPRAPAPLGVFPYEIHRILLAERDRLRGGPQSLRKNPLANHGDHC